MARFIVGVMGGGEGVAPEVYEQAYELGRIIARKGWVLLNGGRAAGVMEASARGARKEGGVTVGVLPCLGTANMADCIDIPIITNMGDARNYINVLSSNVVIALPGGAGTLAEIALALKNGKTVILLNYPLLEVFEKYHRDGKVKQAASPEEAAILVEEVQGAPAAAEVSKRRRKPC